MTPICNIDLILKLRFLFGFYYETGASFKLRLLSKLYCLLVVATLTSVMCIKVDRNHNNLRIAAIEYILYFLVSVFMGEKYIIRYYRRTEIIDSSPYAKKLYSGLEKILLFCIGIKFIVRFGVQGLCFYLDQNPFTDHLEAAFGLLFPMALDMGRFVIIIILMLLFCRVKVLRHTLLTHGFDNSPQNRLTPRKYLHMYNTLEDTIRATDYPLNFLVILSLVGGFSRILLHMNDSIHHLKENGFSEVNLYKLIIASQPALNLMMIVVIMDLTSDYLDDILGFTVLKLTECQNERDRGEIKLLVVFLQNVPLRSGVADIMSLSVRRFLAIFSFWLTTFIAILQIKNFD